MKKISIADFPSRHNRWEIANPDVKIFNIFVLLGVPQATPTANNVCRLTLTVLELNNKKTPL